MFSQVVRISALSVFLAVCIVVQNDVAFATSKGKGKNSVPDRRERKELKCEEFNGIEIKENWTLPLNAFPLGISSSPPDILRDVLRRIGCVIYDGTKKRRGVITIGISVKDPSQNKMPTNTDTVEVVLSWSRGIENAQTSFVGVVSQGFPAREEELRSILAESIKDLRMAIARERRKRDPLASVREVVY